MQSSVRQQLLFTLHISEFYANFAKIVMVTVEAMDSEVEFVEEAVIGNGVQNHTENYVHQVFQSAPRHLKSQSR